VDINNPEEMYKIIRTTLSSKFASRWMDQMCRMALQAVLRVAGPQQAGPKAAFAVTRREIDLKRYAKIEKVSVLLNSPGLTDALLQIPGGEIEQCEVLDGVMINKDVVHPAMKRRIKNPRIVLLDSPLEYKKAESQTNVVLTKVYFSPVVRGFVVLVFHSTDGFALTRTASLRMATIIVSVLFNLRLTFFRSTCAS